MKIKCPSCSKTVGRIDLQDNWVLMDFTITCFKCHISTVMQFGDNYNDCWVEDSEIIDKNYVIPEDLEK